MRGRPILALVFVALTGIVLSIPLRDTAGDGPRVRATPVETPQESPTPADTPTPEESPTPEDSPTPEEVPDTASFTGEFPDRCLQGVDPPTGGGLLAIDQGNRIAVTTLGGAEAALVDDAFPLEWSPSGTYFMAESGTIYDREGGEVASLLSEDTTSYWAWSPIADCVLTTDGTAMSVYVPGGGRETLHSGPITRFAFSPSGGSVAYVEEDEETGAAHLWVASLADGNATRLTTLELADDEEIVLGGWTPDASHVLFWQGSPDELLDPGRRLQAVSAGGRVRALSTVLAQRDFLALCGDDLLAVVGGGARLGADPKRLAAIDVGRSPRALTPAGNHDVSVSCAPGGGFAATARAAQPEGQGPRALTVIDLQGGTVLSAQNGSFNDQYSIWGRGGTGLVFVRRPLDGGNPVLWRIPEGGGPGPMGITLTGVDDQPAHFRDSWGHWIAWSAEQPSGLYSTSGP